MDKNAIKKYAVWARREMITRVAGRAANYGITADDYGNPNAESINGRVLAPEERQQRAAFITKISQEGYEQAVEEVAYTWFNRFCALRYMEVNGYLPSHIRVFTNDSGEFKPQILDEAIHINLNGLDIDKVYDYKDSDNEEELYRYLLIVQCNSLNYILPGMFQKIADYTELLLPDNLLREGSVIEQMVTQIPEEDWTDQVQIIGWLYQYYNAEKKDEVFDALKRKHIKITRENIPAATQLFTPDWIVRYMVENSLGRLWEEGHPNEELKGNWKYYLEEAQQVLEVEGQLAEIRKEYAELKPEDIKCIDPCCGSGHILVYMFDVLMQIYQSYGYNTQDAVSSILENNLYGLDIDDRAAQLAYFSVMMKARSYDKRFFDHAFQPHVYAICESNSLDQNLIEYFVGDDSNLKKDFDILMEELNNAKEYGSILTVSQVNYASMYKRVEEIEQEINFYTPTMMDPIMTFIHVAEILAQKYNVVITNPPYMGIKSGMSDKLASKIKKEYPESKSDFYAVFMNRCIRFTKKNYFTSMITQHSWMFQTSFVRLRDIVLNNTLMNVIHLGPHAFEEINGEVVQTVSFVLRKKDLPEYRGVYIRLLEGLNASEKEKAFFDNKNYYIASVNQFKMNNNHNISYWLNENYYKLLKLPRVEEYAYTFQGIITGDTEKYLKLWFEPVFQDIHFGIKDSSVLESISAYFPYNKGGSYRRWYGNQEYVIFWGNSGRNFVRSRTENREYFFKKGITWSDLCTGLFSCRLSDNGFLFDATGPMLFPKHDKDLESMCGYFNSKVFQYFLDVSSRGLHYGNGAISAQPFISNCYQVNSIVKQCVIDAKADWDSFETSWNFQRHPLVRTFSTVKQAFDEWQEECKERFNHLKGNEEELNRIFIDIYGLQDELAPEEEDKDVTVRKANLQREIKSLISYAVGCMFGRYSLDVDGLVSAGGEWNNSEYNTFIPDSDGIIPICDDEYFTDDIVGRFEEFVEIVYGKDTLEENLKFIADALGGSGTPRQVIRKYFLNDFFKDHCKIYQKRPIYWLFDSGQKNGFKCLIYMHRYQPDTIARIRTDYVHEQQARYRTAMADLQERIKGTSKSDRIKFEKQLAKLQDQAEELQGYEEKIHHLADQFIDIDMDDGVKVNYAKFQDVLAKV